MIQAKNTQEHMIGLNLDLSHTPLKYAYIVSLSRAR